MPLKVRECKKVDVLSYSTLVCSASQEHWCLQKQTDVAVSALPPHEHIPALG